MQDELTLGVSERNDEAGMASIMEHMERMSCINSVRSSVFQGTVEDAIKKELIYEGKCCNDCGEVIPFERQKVSPKSERCVDCQDFFDKQQQKRSKLYQKDSYMSMFG